MRSLFFLVLFFFTSLAFAENDLNARFNAVQSMQAQFIQTVFDNHGKAVQRSYGKMAFSKPGNFRWQVTKPIPQVIIANRTRLWIYDPDLEQVTVRALSPSVGEAPALLLSHEDASINADFIVKSLPDKGGLGWFRLIPKQADNMFAAVEMGFNRDSQITEMRLTDHLGHTTLIEFQHIQTNIPIPSSQFNFHPPANVDVIDETKAKRAH